MGPKFPKTDQKTMCFHSKNEPHGILNRFHYNEPKTQHLVQNRPWVPRAESQDYGSLHKLPQIKY